MRQRQGLGSQLGWRHRGRERELSGAGLSSKARICSFVTRARLQPGRNERKTGEGFSPCHGASSSQCGSGKYLEPVAHLFRDDKHEMGKRLFQSERNAGLLIEVLRSLVAEHRFKLHDFVIMPNHVHLLVEVGGEMTIEKAMQLIKGRFSHRLSHEFDYKGEVWQRGFTEEQVLNKQSFDTHRDYIAENPVKARLAASAEEYPVLFSFFGEQEGGKPE